MELGLRVRGSVEIPIIGGEGVRHVDAVGKITSLSSQARKAIDLGPVVCREKNIDCEAALPEECVKRNGPELVRLGGDAFGTCSSPVRRSETPKKELT